MSELNYDQRYQPSEEAHADSRLLAVVAAPTPDPKSRQRFQYLTGSVPGNRLDAVLNGYGKEGWRLCFCTPHKTVAGFPDGAFVVILERELSSDESDTPVL